MDGQNKILMICFLYTPFFLAKRWDVYTIKLCYGYATKESSEWINILFENSLFTKISPWNHTCTAHKSEMEYSDTVQKKWTCAAFTLPWWDIQKHSWLPLWAAFCGVGGTKFILGGLPNNLYPPHCQRRCVRHSILLHYRFVQDGNHHYAYLYVLMSRQSRNMCTFRYISGANTLRRHGTGWSGWPVLCTRRCLNEMNSLVQCQIYMRYTRSICKVFVEDLM